MVFISFKTRKEHTAVPVPWLFDSNLAVGALLGKDRAWMLCKLGSEEDGAGEEPPGHLGTGLPSSSVLIHCVALHPPGPPVGQS